MKPYSSHYSKGKYSKKNFEVQNFCHRTHYKKFLSKSNFIAFLTELRESFLSVNEDFSEL
jgi:hypothetical protein